MSSDTTPKPPEQALLEAALAWASGNLSRDEVLRAASGYAGAVRLKEGLRIAFVQKLNHIGAELRDLMTDCEAADIGTTVTRGELRDWLGAVRTKLEFLAKAIEQHEAADFISTRLFP